MPQSLRRLTPEGLDEFERRWAVAANSSPKTLMMTTDIINDSEWTELVSEAVDVVPRRFVNGMAAGGFFHDLFNQAREDIRALSINPRTDQRLWAWLSATWSHELQHEDDPKDPSLSGTCATQVEKGYVGERSRWIYEFNDSQRWYRHLLAAPYRIYVDALPLVGNALILLDGDAFIHPANRFRETICGSPELYSDRDLVGWLSDRFRDPKSGRIGDQAAIFGSKKASAGSIDRLTKKLNQLVLTHDLSQLNRTQKGELLSEEFDGILDRP
jgi:hypothetical protein